MAECITGSMSGSLSAHLSQLIALAFLCFVGVRFVRSAPRIRFSPSPVSLLFLLLCSCALGCSHLLLLHKTVPLLFIGFVACFMWSACGSRFVRHWSPVLLFALFLMPSLPAELIDPVSLLMRRLSTIISTAMASAVIPIRSAGNVFWVGGHEFDVAPACSGLSMWKSFAFLAFFWNLIGLRRSSFLIVLTLIPVLAVLLNSVRLCITALVAYFRSPSEAMAIHSNLEFVLFPLGLLLLYLAGTRFAATTNEETKQTTIEPVQSAMPSHMRMVSLASITALILLPAAVTSLVHYQMPAAQRLLVPIYLMNFHGCDEVIDEQTRKIYSESENELLDRTYSRPGEAPIELLVAQSRLDGEPHPFDRCVECSGAVFLQRRPVHFAAGNKNMDATFMEYKIDGQLRNSLVWFQWPDRTVPSDDRRSWIMSKIHHIWSRDSGVCRTVMITSNCDEKADATLRRLEQFATALSACLR